MSKMMLGTTRHVCIYYTTTSTNRQHCRVCGCKVYRVRTILR